MPLPSFSLCCLRRHRSQHLNHPPPILVWYPLLTAGSIPTYHLAPFVLNVITTFLPCIPPLLVFPKALFSALQLFIVYTTRLSTLIS